MLQIRKLTKTYTGTQALDSLDLDVARGEVVAIVGENGAGKSTLARILGGQVIPDGGEIILDGVSMRFSSPKDAISAGIWLVNQELSICEGLNITLHFFLGREPTEYGFLLDQTKMLQEAQLICDRVHLSASPLTGTELLNIGDLQKVEIGKALLRKPLRVLILDEASSSLAYEDFQLLVSLIEELKRNQTAIIYITHRFHELAKVADRIAVLRDGRLVAVGDAGEMEAVDILAKMSGRRTTSSIRQSRPTMTSPVLRVRDLRTFQFPAEEISVDLHEGEIIGLRGDANSGADSFLEAIFGIRKPVGGEISVFGNALTLGNIRSAVTNGVAFVPEDRGRLGLIPDLSVGENLLMPWLRTRSFFRFDFKTERQTARSLIEQLRITPPDEMRLTRELSGGNQQKVVLAKWLAIKPRILLLDNPTRGVDVLTRAELHDILIGLADKGCSIFVRSTDESELQILADRILTMTKGRIDHHFPSAPRYA